MREWRQYLWLCRQEVAAILVETTKEEMAEDFPVILLEQLVFVSENTPIKIQYPFLITFNFSLLIILRNSKIKKWNSLSLKERVD